MILSAERALIGSRLIENVSIEIENETIINIGDGVSSKSFDEFIEGTVVPGFVDIHSHGGGGFSFSSNDPTEIAKILEVHRKHGTTSQIASLVTEPLENLHQQIAALLPYFESGAISGIHLEGPYLSPSQCGAHDPALLRMPNLSEISDLIHRGEGAIRMITIAPELPNAIEAIAMMVELGVVAAIGHSEADFDTARHAMDAGATVVTHFFNGLRKIDHRDPALMLACLLDDKMILELILDDHHVKGPAVDLLLKCAPSRVALITDAMAAAGAGDGSYKIGSLDVVVKDGVARLVSNASLAGSTLTMDSAFRRLAEAHEYSVAAASFASSTLPARALGLAGIGEISVGAKANLVALKGTRVNRVMSRGIWLA
jgi:N-acetylglucosamine-6-phosphate deacetylase